MVSEDRYIAKSSALSSIVIFVVFIVGVVISFVTPNASQGSPEADGYAELGLFVFYVFIGSILIACLLSTGRNKVFMVDTWIALLAYFLMCFLPVNGIQFIPLIYVIFTVMKSAKTINAKLLANCSRQRILENRFYVASAAVVTLYGAFQPYVRSDDNFLDNGLIDIVLVILLLVSTMIFSISKNHLRYPVLWFTYLGIAVFSLIKLGDKGDGLYDLRSEAQVNTFRIVSIVSLVLMCVMFLRSGMYKYRQQPQ